MKVAIPATSCQLIDKMPQPSCLSRPASLLLVYALQMDALVSAAVRAAHKVDAKLIVAFTVSGRTARLLAK